MGDHYGYQSQKWTTAALRQSLEEERAHNSQLKLEVAQLTTQKASLSARLTTSAQSLARSSSDKELSDQQRQMVQAKAVQLQQEIDTLKIDLQTHKGQLASLSEASSKKDEQLLLAAARSVEQVDAIVRLEERLHEWSEWCWTMVEREGEPVVPSLESGRRWRLGRAPISTRRHFLETMSGEIMNIILGLCSTSSLATLCLVSPGFLAISSSVLYRSVDIPHTNLGRLFSPRTAETSPRVSSALSIDNIKSLCIRLDSTPVTGAKHIPALDLSRSNQVGPLAPATFTSLPLSQPSHPSPP